MLTTMKMMTTISRLISLLLVLLAVSGTMRMAQAQEEEDCSSIATCVECLSATTGACGFWLPDAGENGICANDCILQDASCYTNKTFENFSAEETCAAVETKAADDELCATQGANSCSDCVTTIVSDGISTPCQWFHFSEDGPQYCANGCGIDGCGATTCNPNGDTITVPTTTTTNNATTPPTAAATTMPPTSLCGLVKSCNECLETEGCGFWQSATGCASECMVQDVSCYNAATEDQPVDEICQDAENALADAALCTEQSGCDACVATTLSNGISTCQWFDTVQACLAGCGMDGCGETTCTAVGDIGDITESTVPPASASNSSSSLSSCDAVHTTCEDCLRTEDCGFWQPVSGGSCAAKCLIANASCFSSDPFSNKNVEEICEEVADTVADIALCSSKTSCGVCVGTTLSDGTSTCQWFDDAQSCESACNMDGCGKTTCDATGEEQPTTPDSGAARLVLSILTSGVIATLITATLA